MAQVSDNKLPLFYARDRLVTANVQYIALNLLILCIKVFFFSNLSSTLCFTRTAKKSYEPKTPRKEAEDEYTVHIPVLMYHIPVHMARKTFKMMRQI